MTRRDPMVEEVRKLRAQIAREHGNDVAAIVAALEGEDPAETTPMVSFHRSACGSERHAGGSERRDGPTRRRSRRRGADAGAPRLNADVRPLNPQMLSGVANPSSRGDSPGAAVSEPGRPARHRGG